MIEIDTFCRIFLVFALTFGKIGKKLPNGRKKTDNMYREIEQYKKYLLQKHGSKITVTTYLSEITSFHDFIFTLKSECQSWSEVTMENARDFCYTLLSNGKQGRTINRYITSLRLFYDYLTVLGKVQENPFRQIDFYKIKWGAPLVLNAEQSARLVGAPMREYQVLIETLDGPKPRRLGKLIYLRDQLILEMLYYSGIKFGELLSLCDRDIDCAEMKVSISGKIGRNKSRVLQLPECVIVTFTDYIRCRNDKWPELTLEANPLILRNKFGGPISSRSVRRNIAHYAQKSGLHPGISPDTLRATFTLRALRSGADTATIQYLLGFEDLSSAESYVSRFK
jgi:integrase/recombinase XerC